MQQMTKPVMWAGVALILITGLIHVISAPDSFDEAPYKGVLFLANGVGALLAAAGIVWGNQRWAWWLGMAVAGGAFIGYVLSRTVGLPALPAEPDAWLEPLGVASLVAEGLFIALALYMQPGLKLASQRA